MSDSRNATPEQRIETLEERLSELAKRHEALADYVSRMAQNIYNRHPNQPVQ